jgi:uncharacterized ferredoxin-like protein
MKINFNELKSKTIVEIAKQIALAIQTAPKARGIDNLEILVVTDEDILTLSNQMEKISERDNVAFFKRDAENIKQASAILLVGTEYKSLGLKNCGWCGWKTCTEKEKNSEHPCVYNLTDLGISVGSAVSLAADYRIDNRIMFSVGKAAIELNFFSSNVKAALGIPLSATNKNPFFDRKPI